MLKNLAAQLFHCAVSRTCKVIRFFGISQHSRCNWESFKTPISNIQCGCTSLVHFPIVQCGNYAQNFDNIPKVWQFCRKYSQHAHNVAIIPKCGQDAHNVAIMPKIWPTCPQCGNHAQNMVNILKMLPTCPQFGNQAQ